MLKINKKYIAAVMLLFLLVQPIYLTYILEPTRIYKLGRYVLVGGVLLYYIKKRFKTSPLIKTLFFWQLWVYLITVLKGQDVSTALRYGEQLLILFTVFDAYKKNYNLILKAMMLHCELCTYINLLTIVCFPHGFFSRTIAAYGSSQEWFLGVHNYFIVWLFPSLVVASIYKEVIGNKIRANILMISVVITAIINMSGTGRVAIFSFLIIMYLPNIIKKHMSPMGSMIAVLIGTFVIVVLQKFDFLKVVVVDFLGKDMTMNSRVMIWSNAIKKIEESPLWGYGYISEQNMPYYIGKINSILWKGATHCHCQYLQVLFHGGIIGFLLYIMMLFCAIRSVKKCKNRKIVNICIISIVVFMIMGITEVMTYTFIYSVIPLVYYACKQYEDKLYKV